MNKQTFKLVKTVLFYFLVTFFFTACSSGPKVINNLSDASYNMVNQDSAAFNFTQDLKGKFSIVTFIYTHCPNICPIITANMNKIHKQLGQPSDINFVEVTFDPRRDTPSVLKTYMDNFDLDDSYFTMLTGDSTTVDSVLKKANIKAWITQRDTTSDGKPEYFMKHTNTMFVLDKKARVRFKYPASAVPPKNVIEDLKKIR